jgi:hypothetical protein
VQGVEIKHVLGLEWRGLAGNGIVLTGYQFLLQCGIAQWRQSHGVVGLFGRLDSFVLRDKPLCTGADRRAAHFRTI